MASVPQVVDPAVSRAKFEREVAEYRQIEDEHLARGRWVLKAEYPEVFVVFAVPQLQPSAVAFGAVLDFTNYDLWPPSVRLVHPFTRVPYRAGELPTRLARRGAVRIIEAPGRGQVILAEEQPLMQAFGGEETPFLCLPGVREYHENPGHTGDSWFLHRDLGEGKLYFLLEKLYQYGVQPISGYQVRVSIPGFVQQEVPE